MTASGRGRARRAARGCGRGDRRPRRRGRPGSPARSAPARLGRGVVLGRDQDLGRLLGDLPARPRRRHPRGARRVRPGRPWRPASAIVAQSVSSQAKPCSVGVRAGVRRRAADRVAGGRVEAAPRSAVAGRAGRIDGQEQRVAVAVERDRRGARARSRSSRPSATGGRATASGSGPRPVASVAASASASR